VVNSPIENVYHVAKDFDLSKSKIITFLFKIRGLPTKRLNLQNFIDDIGFTKLEENYPIRKFSWLLGKGKNCKNTKL